MLYPLVIALFFGSVLFYLINYALTPYGEDKMVDIKNISIVTIIFVITITAFFTFFHLVIDKLFFRKFYEKPRMFLALRRGFLLGLFLAGFAWVRVFGFWLLHVVLLIFALVILVEALFLSIAPMQKGSAKKKNNKEDEEKKK